MFTWISSKSNHMQSESIKKFMHSLGADVCGIADVDEFKDAPKGFHPKDIMEDAKSVIVYGKQSSKSLFDAKTSSPYTFVRNKTLEKLDNMTLDLSYKLEEAGYSAIPIPSVEPYDYWDPERRHGRGLLSLKHAAQLAGLGRIGKNTLLINKTYGNRLWLGAILVSVKLDPDGITEHKSCSNSCTICLDACPQKALDGTTINQRLCREKSFTSTEGGGWVIACNTCRKVCPFARVW
jgi:epoxyqueuosine reductase